MTTDKKMHIAFVAYNSSLIVISILNVILCSRMHSLLGYISAAVFVGFGIVGAKFTVDSVKSLLKKDE